MDISTLKNFLIPLKEKMVWDAQWNGYKIEFKKWTSIWLDLIRYSEIVLWTTDNANNETITLFFIPDKDKLKIQEVLWIRTTLLIEKLWLDMEMAKILLEIHNTVPRSLNAQASLTVKDVRIIADFII